MRPLALLLLLSACEEPKDGAVDAPVRPANPTCLAPERPSTGADVALERVWPGLSFDAPVELLQAPGDRRRWFVLEQGGRVLAFDADGDTADATEVLDLTGSVEAGFSETGLLGMAFDPDFLVTGEVYLSYTRPDPLTSVVSRFTSLDGGETLDPTSEEVLLTLRQPYSNHNGGHIAFGPDGYLYVGFGDGGSAGDPEENGQDTGTFLGKILRIDVGGEPYGIPADNPFADGEGGLPEIYAWGLRNPWKFSFDTASGELWVGDVGQDRREEVDLVELGGNYGWNLKEGTQCYAAEDPCDGGGLIDPIVEYPHTQGESITGGFVYHGTEIPAFDGTYFYADYVSGTVWALTYDEAGEPDPTVVVEAGFYVSTFGQGEDGELYLVDYLGGGIRKLVATDGEEPAPFPETLAETGCFDADGTPVEGLIPYTVNAPLWSDGAAKSRWFAIPDGTTIEVDEAGDFDFPVGAVLAKHFALDGEDVETRLFVRHEDGEWAGYSYAWRDGAATLLAGAETRAFGDQLWEYPSRAQCLQCHTGAAGRALGPEVSQVDRVGEDGEDQLATWHAMGLFAGGLPDVAALPSPTGDAPLEDRARAYLHANCSNCHRPEGTGQGPADFRATTALAGMSICGQEPQEGDLGVDGAVLLDPGSPETSILSLRMHALDANRMPEVGTRVVDEDGVAVIDEWIRSLSGCP